MVRADTLSSFRLMTTFSLWLVGPVRWDHDTFQSVPLRLHSHMKIVPQDLLRDVTDDLPDRLLPSSALSQLRDERVTMVVPPACDLRILSNVLPRRLEGRHVSSGIQIRQGRKKAHTTYTIPESVARRIHTRLSHLA
jgi:hypothetical protein